MSKTAVKSYKQVKHPKLDYQEFNSLIDQMVDSELYRAIFVANGRKVFGNFSDIDLYSVVRRNSSTGIFMERLGGIRIELTSETRESWKVILQNPSSESKHYFSFTHALVLSDCDGVLSEPLCDNDNPYSEAQFKTLKYCPQFPDRFGSIQDARSFCRTFFNWYNEKHHHSGIALMTPEQIHYGLSDEVYYQRSKVLKAAYMKNPNRFKYKLPTPEKPPETAWINKPDTEDMRV